MYNTYTRSEIQGGLDCPKKESSNSVCSLDCLIIVSFESEFYMGRLGFEPRTIRLKAEYSTVELATRLLQFIFATFANVSRVFAVAQVV